MNGSIPFHDMISGSGLFSTEDGAVVADFLGDFGRRCRAGDLEAGSTARPDPHASSGRATANAPPALRPDGKPTGTRGGWQNLEPCVSTCSVI